VRFELEDSSRKPELKGNTVWQSIDRPLLPFDGQRAQSCSILISIEILTDVLGRPLKKREGVDTVPLPQKGEMDECLFGQLENQPFDSQGVNFSTLE